MTIFDIIIVYTLSFSNINSLAVTFFADALLVN